MLKPVIINIVLLCLLSTFLFNLNQAEKNEKSKYLSSIHKTRKMIQGKSWVTTCHKAFASEYYSTNQIFFNEDKLIQEISQYMDSNCSHQLVSIKLEALYAFIEFNIFDRSVAINTLPKSLDIRTYNFYKLPGSCHLKESEYLQFITNCSLYYSSSHLAQFDQISIRDGFLFLGQKQYTYWGNSSSTRPSIMDSISFQSQ